MHFFKKIYKKYVFIYSGRDGIGTTSSRVPSRPEEKFCHVPKLFGIEISRPKMPWDGMGRAGRDETGNFEHPYFNIACNILKI